MKNLYLMTLAMMLGLHLQAKHIIGGVLTYECLGGGEYKFTLKMYRDCSDPTGADFDFNAPFSIYEEAANGSYNLLTTIYRNPDIITDIDPEENPCLTVPPSVCVQEGIYSFNFNFPNWPSNSSYHISYQRCCRNATVSNIINPGQVGATFTVELTPASQALCNNSPVYNTFPPIVLCTNEPLSYDHSAFDTEGDQLTYEFCSPLLGGGQGGLGGGNPDACNGITPDPACPPPYLEASFVNPPYGPLNPMAGNPQVSINAFTGLLSGTPNIQGQFSVGVCVKEYRNGQLLSVIRRDFQFNVLNCEAVVDASLNAPNVQLLGDDYYISTCNVLEIPFQNTSNSIDNVDLMEWRFDVNGTVQSYNTWDATFTFPSSGSFEGMLLLNPGLQCNDTANILVEIFPEVLADFDYDYDTCIAGPVSFLNKSAIQGAGQIAEWVWHLDQDLRDSTQWNPVYAYEEPGLKPVKLEVWDEHGCMDDTLQLVRYQPVPAIIFVKPNDTISCAPATVFFNNQSSPLDETYDIRWSFGDGGQGTDISPTHTYLDTGLFDVRLEITSPIGCNTDTTFSQLVNILSPPVADFSFDPTTPDNFNPIVNFYDESLNAVHWDWYVNGKLTSQMQDFTYDFPDTGLHAIMLVVVHPEKCLDTALQYIDVIPKITYYLPNAFTPNEDTVNDIFQGTGFTRGITNFKLTIWDRYGLQVFDTKEVEEAWNGRIGNTGKLAQSGVYVYVASFTGPRGEPFNFRGYATLIR